MMFSFVSPLIRTTLSCILLLPCANSVTNAQSFPENSPRSAPLGNAPQLLAPNQLDSLVAPVALYPDPLLSQVLVASTYPLEIVEAQQWLQQNRNLQGQSLIAAAKQQDWDPSVQALAVFPDVLALLTRDVRWTTDLGNAFLDQQADVMNAIQRLRAQANSRGRLTSTPQQIVTDETQNDQSAIEIQPANPQMVYPPVYDPAYVWGPAVSPAYPAVYYPSNSGRPLDQQGEYGPGQADGSAYGNGDGSGGGYGFGNGVNLPGLFSGLLSGASGVLGSGGWGWALNWFTHSLLLNDNFLNNFGFNNSGAGFASSGGRGPSAWVHNPAHRLGVPYSNAIVSARLRGADSRRSFNFAGYSGSSFGPGRYATGNSAGTERSTGGWRSFGGGNRTFSSSSSSYSSSSSGWRGFNGGNRGGESYNRSAAPSYGRGYDSNNGGFSRYDRGYSNSGNQRAASGFQGGGPSDMASSFRGAAPSGRSAPSSFAERRAPSQRFSSGFTPSRQNFSAPREKSSGFFSKHFSAPRSSAARSSSHVSAPRRSSGSHSGGGGNSSHARGGHSGKSSRKR